MAKVVAVLCHAGFDTEQNKGYVEACGSVIPQAGEVFQGQAFESKILVSGTETKTQINSLILAVVKKDTSDLSGVSVSNNDIVITNMG